MIDFRWARASDFSRMGPSIGRPTAFGLKDAAAAEPNRAARVSGDSLSRVGCCNLRLHFRDQGNVRGFEAYCLCLDGIPRMGRGQGTIGTDMIKNIQPNVGEAQNGNYSTAARA